MGWHYILHVQCQLLLEYIPFIRDEYLRNYPTIERLNYNDYTESKTSTKGHTYSSDEKSSSDSDSDSEQRWTDEELGPSWPNDSVPNTYRSFIQTWIDLEIGPHFYNYDLTDSGIFTCHIEKKVSNHTNGDLWEAYEEFLKYVIVPISSEIISCRIESDDFGDRKEIYTDSQLRNIEFNLKKWIRHIEHVYEDDMIVETRVVWKRPFKRELELDVSRMFERTW